MSVNYTPQQENYKDLTPFKLLCLQNFPYIEADFDALTNYQLMCKIVEYLNNTIFNQNQVQTNVSNLYNAFNSLQTYVNNYFNNLDVQDEINNKLDEMAEDGSLYSIIREYTDPIISIQNERISQVESEVRSSVSGAPAGVYPTLAALQSADPDHSKIYIVNADGEWYFWNTSTSQWKNGGVYQASVDSNTLTNIDTKINTLWGNILPVMNYLDNLKIEKGMRYDRLNTNKLAYASTALAQPIPVKKGVTYRCDKYLLSKPWSHICDSEGNIIEAEFPQSATDFHEFTPTVDGYAYLTFQSFNASSDVTDTTMVFIKDYPLPSFMAYNNPIDFIILDKSYKETNNIHNTITVGNNKNFSTIASAIASITNSSASNIYDILIDDGTYNEKNLTLPNYVNLIGASGNRENCIIRGYLNPDSSDSVINPTSTINISNNNELHNLTITAQNMRYPVHDESGGNNKNWKQIVDNCYIEHLGNQEVINYRNEHGGDPSTVWSSCHGWGEGSSSGAYLKISNTTIKSTESSFYTHGANNITDPYYHELVNCELIVTNPNVDSSIYVNDTTSPINGNTLIVKDCYINGRVSIVGTLKYNMMISGSGVHPIYQKPERVLTDTDFPIFTDYIEEYKASENISKGMFVYTTDGKTIKKATSTTPNKLIVGYAIGNHNQGDNIRIMKGYLQPTNQTWPETDVLTSGKYYKVGDNSLLVETTNINEAIAISSNRFYKLFI